MSLKTRGLDPDEHAVIIARAEHDEWKVEFKDGAEAWRGHAEMLPASASVSDG